MNSRNKGANGERQLAKALKAFGYEARRGQQYSGLMGDADVIGLEGIHIECKRVEDLDLEQAYAQSRRDARLGEIPVVMWRKNYQRNWSATLTVTNLMRMLTGDEAEYKSNILTTLKLEAFMEIYEGWRNIRHR